MALRSVFAAAVALFLLAPGADAIETGRAEGTATINRKAVKLKFAYAKMEKDYEQKDQWTVILTDRAVSRAFLNDDSRFRKGVENGDVVAARLRFDESKALEQAEVLSKALQHKALPMSAASMKLTGLTIGSDAVEGKVATTKDEEFFSDVATLSVSFRAALGNEGSWGDNALAAKELAASAPKLADGAASGTLKINDETVKLAHSIARTKPNSFDEKKTDVVILLTDQPATAEMLVDSGKLYQAAENGSLRGLIITVDSDEKPYHMMVLHPKANFQLSGSGFWNFDTTDYSTSHVSGRFFTTREEDFMGKTRYSYDVTFKVPVQAIAEPKELTLDASTGTKLPPNGGEPGKAYMAFDKASRTGNIAEIKKYASKTRPLPDLKPEELKEMIAMIRLMRPVKVKITGGFANADHATLHVEGESPDDKSKMHGTIEMAKEDGIWKIMGESWKN